MHEGDAVTHSAAAGGEGVVLAEVLRSDQGVKGVPSKVQWESGVMPRAV